LDNKVIVITDLQSNSSYGTCT